MKRTILWIALGLAVNLPVSAQLQLSQAQCREMALKNNEEMRKATNSYQQAKLDKEIAFAAYLPELEGSLTGIYRKDMDMMEVELQMRGTYLAGITLNQPIFAGGKIIANNKLARIGVECAEESRRKTEMDIISEADNAYWTYVAVGEKVILLEAYQKQLNELHKQISKSVEVQMATKSDLLRIDTKRSQILYQLTKAKNGVELCRMSLCSTLGIDIQTEIQATEKDMNISAPQRLEENIFTRPEYRLLVNQIEAQKLLTIELQQAILNVTDGYNLIETANTGMEQATENLRNMQNNYDVSMCTLTDLLDAQAQWQESYSRQIEAKTQYKIYESEYMRVSGQLRP